MPEGEPPRFVMSNVTVAFPHESALSESMVIARSAGPVVRGGVYTGVAGLSGSATGGTTFLAGLTTVFAEPCGGTVVVVEVAEGIYNTVSAMRVLVVAERSGTIIAELVAEPSVYAVPHGICANAPPASEKESPDVHGYRRA